MQHEFWDFAMINIWYDWQEEISRFKQHILIYTLWLASYIHMFRCYMFLGKLKSASRNIIESSFVVDLRIRRICSTCHYYSKKVLNLRIELNMSTFSFVLEALISIQYLRSRHFSFAFVMSISKLNIPSRNSRI